MAPNFNNQAAWIETEKARPLVVGPGPKPAPEENEVVIKVAYAAVNPVDWKMQAMPNYELPYPWIFGVDVAGTIVELGSSVKRFQIGQRVIGHCDGYLSRKMTNNSFQLYSTCLEVLVAAVPDSLPLANAAVLPLAVSTAATGLFRHLKLPSPTLDPASTGKTILIWGGSSSCGSAAIQLAIAAGLDVITTASLSNHEYTKSLGASTVFDYRDPDVIEKITAKLKPGDHVMDCIGEEATQTACAKIQGMIGGGIFPMTLWKTGTFPENVEGIFVNALDPAFTAPDVGDAVWRKYLPQALESGQFQAKPDPLIIEGGLEKVQDGLDILKAGVSARKVVIEISKDIV